jgi:protease stability complex PrcB-like protein
VKPRGFGHVLCVLCVFSVLSVSRFSVSSAVAQTQSFTTVAKGDASEQQTARQVTVRTAAEWKALWKEHAPTAKMPAVDFSRDMVVGVFLGSKPSAGHDVEIVGVRLEEKELIVEYVQKQPGRGTVAAQILTEPYHLVTVPKHAGTVRFVHIPDNRK